MQTGNGQVAGRVSAAEATPQLAAAECEREMKCKNIGESLNYTSINECKRAKSADLTKDFNNDEDCRSGISSQHLEKCVTKTVDQTCATSIITNAQVSAACGSNDLCVD